MSDSSSLRYGILDSGSDALRTNAPRQMLPLKCFLKQNALQSYPRQPNLIDAPDLPTLVNGFETMLLIYLSSTPLIHEFFLGSIFFQGAF